MLTREEITFMYQLLDKINVSGEDAKRQVLVIMEKLRQMLEQLNK